MLLTGRRLKGSEAFDSGMVNRLVSRDRLLQSAEEAALKIASYNPVVVRSAKQAIVRGVDMTLEQGLDLERHLAAECRS
jgi:enoyl-CoA hydratase/carnithine racemase